MITLLWIAFAFFCGSLPFSVWLGKIALRKDIRQYGDANPGAANVFRAGSKGWGAIAILLDILKGAIPVGLANYGAGITDWSLALIAIAPVAGHAFSPFLRFKGGKAIAVSLGIWCGLTLYQVPLVLGLDSRNLHRVVHQQRLVDGAGLCQPHRLSLDHRRALVDVGRVAGQSDHRRLETSRRSHPIDHAAPVGESAYLGFNQHPERNAVQSKDARTQIMTDQLWIDHVGGIVIFLAILLLISFINLLTLKRLGKFPDPLHSPRVSLLVPARNEARNIEGCVRGLLAQDYPAFEVIILDDESTDGTGEILERLVAEDARLRVIHGQPLPAGWLGKNWACQQLSQAAGGEYLLFTDADTCHDPLMLRDSIAAALATNADLLSGMPHQEVKTWSEQLLVPILAWSFMAFIPIALAERVRAAFLSVSIGQFLLFRRSAYDAQRRAYRRARQSGGRFRTGAQHQKGRPAVALRRRDLTHSLPHVSQLPRSVRRPEQESRSSSLATSSSLRWRGRRWSSRFLNRN